MARDADIEQERSTRALLEHATREAKLLAQAEILHAKLELRDELRKAVGAGIALGTAAVLGLCGLTLLFVAVAFALPIAGWGASLIVGLALLTISGIAAAIGYRKLPKKPMQRTRERLLEDVRLTRERLA